MEERRHFVRLDTRLQLAYTVLPTAHPAEALTKNIGGGGICLFTDSVLKAGTRLEVTMTLPDQKAPIRFTAEVIWSEAYELISGGKTQRSVESGIEFVAIAPEDQAAILRHVILTLKPA